MLYFPVHVRFLPSADLSLCASFRVRFFLMRLYTDALFSGALFSYVLFSSALFPVTVSARAAYLRRLRSSAPFAAVPVSIADLFRCTPAKVSANMQSQTKLLPSVSGETVISSGPQTMLGIPSPLSKPGGSRTVARWQAGFL